LSPFATLIRFLINRSRTSIRLVFAIAVVGFIFEFCVSTRGVCSRLVCGKRCVEKGVWKNAFGRGQVRKRQAPQLSAVAAAAARSASASL
jgi:hypothetical protein